MRVIELYNPHVHSVCYSVHVEAGSLTDALSRPGVALLTQRMVLEAETRDFHRRSPAGRICNGAVAPAEAFVYVHGHRSNGTEIADIVPSFLNDPNFDVDVLERERAIIWDNLPDTAEGSLDVGELINRLLIQPDMNWSTFGGRDSISEIGVEDIEDRFEECWLDGNAVLSVAGAYKRSDLERCVEALSRSLRPRSPATMGPACDILSSGRRMAVAPVNDDRFSLHLLFPCCGVDDPEAPLVQILDVIVGDGPDSRVRRRLSWESGLAESAGSQPWVLGDRIILEVSVEGSIERLQDISKVFVRTVESLLMDPPEIDEVHEARQTLRCLRDFQMDEPQSAAPARGAQFFASRLGTAEEMDERSSRPSRVTPDDIYTVAQRVLSWDNLSVLYVGPQTSAVDAILTNTWTSLDMEVWDTGA
ncbi:MAG: insulinase family protein [Armatimonadetes bacterium]|jgi:predicted Zn-dependent peptidase|nr:insulinase family protein [Armatimonadota bacterium]MDI9600540.1 insulinase family protein [Acidobacteriota bacterium]NLN88873.1 insulinase family protein [candidate division WS1 bacterium]